MQIIENENGTFKLTAENEIENRLVTALTDVIWNGDYSEEILNGHGCIVQDDENGKQISAFNYVTIPEAEIFAEEIETV